MALEFKIYTTNRQLTLGRRNWLDMCNEKDVSDSCLFWWWELKISYSQTIIEWDTIYNQDKKYLDPCAMMYCVCFKTLMNSIYFSFTDRLRCIPFTNQHQKHQCRHEDHNIQSSKNLSALHTSVWIRMLPPIFC